MIVNYVLILITLLLVSGLVVDAGLLEWRQLHLQTAADAAAQEAMLQFARGDTNWSSEGEAQSAFNGFTNGVNHVSVSVINPPTVSGTYSGYSLAVEAKVSQTVGNLFMGFVNGGNSTVGAVAIASVIPTCAWIMNPNNGNSSGSFQLASCSFHGYCGFYSNTATGNNLTVDYFSTLSMARTRVVGSSANNSSSGNVIPKPIFAAAHKNDPLAYVTAPTISSCSASATTLSGVTQTISPGTYCGGTTISSSSTITLNPGTYIFADGLTIKNSTIYGTAGVTIYLTKYSSSSYTNASITSSTLYLKAPVTSSGGGIPGVLVFADRNWVAHGSACITVQNSTVKADGIWYAPNIGMTFSNNNWNPYKYSVWIIDNFYQYTGTTWLGGDYSDFTNSVSPLHYEDGVLVQ